MYFHHHIGTFFFYLDAQEDSGERRWKENTNLKRFSNYYMEHCYENISTQFKYLSGEGSTFLGFFSSPLI